MHQEKKPPINRNHLLFSLFSNKSTISLISQSSSITPAAIASYNLGPRRVLMAIRRKLDFDFYTTGGDYSADVLNRADSFNLKAGVSYLQI